MIMTDKIARLNTKHGFCIHLRLLGKYALVIAFGKYFKTGNKK